MTKGTFLRGNNRRTTYACQFNTVAEYNLVHLSFIYLFSVPAPLRRRAGALSVSTTLRALRLIERGGAPGITGSAHMRVAARKQMPTFAANALNLGI